MLDKFLYHKDDPVAYLHKSLGRYDFKTFYVIGYIFDSYQELIWIDL